MSDIETRGGAASDAERAILGGAIRKDLGLETRDLRPGLTVAKNLLLRGSKAEALRIYVALVLCEPMNAEFQIGLANCAMLLGENHLALQAASVVVALEPRNPRGYYVSGRACLALRHYAEAEEDLRDAAAFAKAARDEVIALESDKLLDKIAALKS